MNAVDAEIILGGVQKLGVGLVSACPFLFVFRLGFHANRPLISPVR